MKKAFAVKSEKISRKESYSPLSANWTLYKPEVLAKELNLDPKIVHIALEKTGFNKAVRIREELIKYKERLRKEQRGITMRREVLKQEQDILVKREGQVREALENIRNILRIQREAI